MKKNTQIYILVIILITIIAIAAAYFVISNQEPVYKTIEINHMEFSVPNSTVEVNSSNNGWAEYNSKDICIYSFESTNAGLDDVVSLGIEFKTIQGVLEANNEAVTVDNVTLNKTSNGNYSYYYGDNATHQNIIITAKDPKVLVHAVKSMKYLNNTNDTTNTSTDSSSSSSSVTSKCPNCQSSNAHEGSYYWIGHKEYCSVCGRLVADLDDEEWQAEERAKHM